MIQDDFCWWNEAWLEAIHDNNTHFYCLFCWQFHSTSALSFVQSVIKKGNVLAHISSQSVMIARHFNRSEVKCGPPSICLINFEVNTLFCGAVSHEFSLTSICFLASWLLVHQKFQQKDTVSFISFMINSVNVQKAKLTKAWHDKFWGCHIKVKIQL